MYEVFLLRGVLRGQDHLGDLPVLPGDAVRVHAGQALVPPPPLRSVR